MAHLNNTLSTSRESWSVLDAINDWQAWCEHLATRTDPAPLNTLHHGRSPDWLHWGVSDDIGPEIHPPGAGDLEHWISNSQERRPHPTLGYQCLAWAELLPGMTKRIPEETWSRLLDTLVKQVHQSQELVVTDHPLSYTLMAGELGITLSYLLPELPSCQRLFSLSSHALSTTLIELLDGEGLPHASQLDKLRLLLASWTRCDRMSSNMVESCFHHDARTQFEWAVRQAVLWTRPNSSQFLGTATPHKSWHTGCAAALEQGGDEVDWYLASRSLLTPGQRDHHRESFQDVNPATLPPMSVHSEWSEVTLMRTGSDRPSQQLVMRHDLPTITTELMRRKHCLWRGDWNTRITINDSSLDPSEEWDVTCWHSDPDVDYLELQIDLSDDWKLQRQILLAHTDQFLYIADAVIGPATSHIQYSSRLPLAPEASFESATSSHEGILTTGNHTSLVLPLACPEWRAEASLARLTNLDDTLEYSCQAHARNLYAPLFIDLSPSGSRKPFTWRQLTVAHLLDIQPGDVAAGYRVQIGSRQWLAYRSLDPPANRTVLGQNITNEFILGRFTRHGDFQELIGIE